MAHQAIFLVLPWMYLKIRSLLGRQETRILVMTLVQHTFLSQKAKYGSKKRKRQANYSL